MTERKPAAELIHHPYQPPAGFASPAVAVHKGSSVFFEDVAALKCVRWADRDAYTYGLHGTPTTFALEARLATLEGAQHVLLAPSGLAALNLVNQSLLKSGDQLLIPDNVYGPSRNSARHELAGWGIDHAVYDPLDPADLAAKLTPATRLVWLEAAGSITLEFPDLMGLIAAVRAGAPQALIALDNTWGAGLAFKPLAHGIDVSVQAVTKYAAGHSDLLMGAIAVKDRDVGRQIDGTLEDMGWHVSPDDAWLALRGVRTLPLRYEAQARSALTVAQWLKAQPEVADVLHPPLPGSVGHDLWRRDFDGAASLMGVVMKGGDTAAAHAFMRALSLFGMGYSWGGFESLITFETPQLAHRQHAPDLSGQLLRLHIGLEDPADLIGDLEKGLKAWRALQDSNLKPAD